MKIFAISDLHMSVANPKPMNIFGGKWDNYLQKISNDWLKKVGDEDVVLIGGDISWAMTTQDAILDFEYFKCLKGKKVFVRGNHDYWWKSINKLRELVPENCYLLQNDAIKIENVVICGSRGWLTPGSPDFTKNDEKLYLRETERIRLAVFNANRIKEQGDKVICLTHFPPFNIKRDDNNITQLFEKNGVDAVVYGHLHGKDALAEKVCCKNGVKYLLSSCDLVENKLISVDL